LDVANSWRRRELVKDRKFRESCARAAPIGRIPVKDRALTTRRKIDVDQFGVAEAEIYRQLSIIQATLTSLRGNPSGVPK
jgi:hypothetical protein